MTEALHKSYCKAGESEFDLPVSLSGLVVTVACAGQVIRINGVDHTFADDEEFTVSDRSDAAFIRAFIVVDTNPPGPPGTEEVRVFVDEVVDDGVDVSHSFDRDGDLVPHAMLYALDIPANTAYLAGIDHNRWCIVADVPEV